MNCTILQGDALELLRTLRIWKQLQQLLHLESEETE